MNLDLRPHHRWIGILLLAIIIGIGNAPIIGIAQNKQAASLAALRADSVKTTASLNQLRDDIAATEKIKTRIGDADAEKILAPIERLRAAQNMERRAAESRLAHFAYTLSPEHKTPIDTVGAGKQDLATSQITLTADAPTDLDAYIFLDALRKSLPGRLTLKQVSLTRIGAPDTPISATNIHLTVSGEWLSNGAAQNLTEDVK